MVAIVALVVADASVILRGLRRPTAGAVAGRTQFWRVAWGFFWGIAVFAVPVVVLSAIGIDWSSAWMNQVETILVLPLMLFAQGIVLAFIVVVGCWIQSFLCKAIVGEPSDVSRAA